MFLFRDSGVKNRIETVANPVCHVASALCSSFPFPALPPRHMYCGSLPTSSHSKPLATTPYPWLVFFSLEIPTFLNYLHMSEYFLKTSRIHGLKTQRVNDNGDGDVNNKIVITHTSIIFCHVSSTILCSLNTWTYVEYSQQP